MNKDIIKSAWKTLANNKQNTRNDHIKYCILRAMLAKGEDKVAIAKHFLHKSFSPITNPNRLANGAHPFGALQAWNLYIHTNSDGVCTSKIFGANASEFLDAEEIKLYNSIASEVTQNKLIRKYSYFFTRQDIFDEYQLVQTAHAALELGSKLSSEEVKNLHFTCCGVEDLDALEAVERVLQSMKLEYVVFREPDIGNQKTAIGVYPVEEHKRGLLLNYNLLRFSRTPIKDADELVEELVEETV